MKKLSKVLSLVLVIAMVFSLCVIGASASYADFTDKDKITEDYKEAVDTMTGVGIIDGMTATTFDAQGNFTRAQAAKIVSYMQLGVTAATALKGTGTGYKDVAATAWYAPYVAYCTQQGIIGGYGNGNFGPNDALTGYQFAKMLLCAVGYGVNKEYTGASWSINVAKDALQKGVFKNVLTASTNSVITREQATQMAFNTLTKVNVVTYSTLLGDYIENSNSITGVTAKGQNLGEKVFKLYKHTNKANDYGYNGHYWYVGTDVKTNHVSGWYMDDTIVDSNYTAAGMTAKQLYNAYTWDASVTVIVNGEADSTKITPTDYKNNNTKVLANRAGAQFNFVDSDGNGAVDTIVVVVTYFGEVTGVTAATSTAPRYVTVKIFNHDAGTDAIVKVESEKLAKNDFVSVIPDGNSNLGNTGVVVEPIAIEKLTATTSTVDKYDSTSVTMNGTAVNYSFVADAPDGASYSFKGATYDFYIVNGFIIGERLNTGSALNYAYLAQSSSNGANVSLINSTDGMLKVKLVYADGTAEVLSYKVAKATSAIATSATTNGGEAIAVGDYYFVVTNASGVPCYFKIESTTADTNTKDAIKTISSINDLADGKAVSYSKNTDGTVTLSAVITKTINSVTSGANVTNTVTLKANVATSGISGMYVNSATKLVVIGADGKATTTTGYANFAAAGVTYTVGTNCGAIFYQYTGATLTDIVVITAKAADASAVYGMYTGKVSVDVNGYSYGFLVNGTETYYVMAAAQSLTKGGLYQLTFADSKATATEVTAANLPGTNVGDPTAVVGATVTAATTEYFAVGTKAFYYNTNSQVTLVDTTACTMVADTIAVGDTVTFVYTTDTNGVNTVVAAFITAHA